MLQKFLNFISQQNLMTQGNEVLLAVSAGIDSTCMAHLFHQSGYKFAIAHCNFGLRGDESDKDQQFVEQLAQQYNCKVHVKRFDTNKYSSQQGISIQMAARDLRYAWFNKLAADESYSQIATAHNLNDSTETLLLNLIKGTGLRGLTGISPKVNNIIRPLLFAHREEIKEYVANNKLVYREDSSNRDIKYQRNLIRHEIIPLMQQINPSLHHTFQQETEIFSSTLASHLRFIEQIKSAVCSETPNGTDIDISLLKNYDLSAPLLYDILEPYGFSYSNVQNILNSLSSEPGRKFFSRKFVLLKDRDKLIIEKAYKAEEMNEYSIDEYTTSINVPVPLKLQRIVRNPEFKIPSDPGFAALNAEKLKYPLVLRRWKKGDSFYPLGMDGKKKLSDYFIDQKIHTLEKKRIWLLTSNNEIVWIVGHRIDNRYKIVPKTQNILLLELK